MNHPALATLVVCSACSLSHSDASEQLNRALQQAVDGADTVEHGVLLVDSPALGLHETYLVGDANPGQPLAADTPFLSASIGKLVVAATMVDLSDDGILSLSEPVSKWLEPDLLAGLPAEGGVAGFDTITLAMLLSHRSGLPDYFDGAHASRDGALDILTLLERDPAQPWSRESALAYTAEHWDPYAAPGEAFLYSDLNYDLAGLVIEAATGEPWHRVVRQRVLDPLHMAHTRVHLFEAPLDGVPTDARARVGEVVITGTPSIGIDGAGGGLMTTTGDLLRFMRGLEAGNPVSLDRLATDWTEDAIHRGIDYGYGAWRIRPGGLFFLLGGLPELTGVSGSTGSYVYRLEDGTVLAGTFDQTDQTEGHVQFLLSKVLPILARIEEDEAR